MKARAFSRHSRSYLGVAAPNPGLVQVCIPASQLWRGVVLVHDTQANRIILAQLGCELPPLRDLAGYDWPGYTPMHHQRVTSAFMVEHQRCAVLNQIGTGKTYSALCAFDHMLRSGSVGRMLVLTTKSTMHSAWGDEVFNQMSRAGIQAEVIYGPSAKRFKLLDESTAQIEILNYDGFNRIAGLAARLVGRYDVVCVDEATAYKNSRSERYKVLYRWLAMAEHAKVRLWLMTGTPTPQSALDAWPLARLIRSPKAPVYFTHARDMLMRQPFPGADFYVNRPDAAERVAEMLQPAIQFKRSVCLDLPDTVFETRNVELTKAQEKVYRNLERHSLATLETGETVSGANEAGVAGRLLQVAAGVAYTDDEIGKVEINPKQRLDEVSHLMREATGKVLIFTPWRGALALLVKHLAKETTVAQIHGDVNAAERRQIFHDFQNTDNPRVIAAVPTTMAHGLTLTAATTIIWYSPPWSNETYQQANGRIERIGKSKSLVVHIVATDFERQVFNRLRAKQKVQGLVVDLVEAETKRRLK